MKLPLVLFLTALTSRQIQAWERSAIDTLKPGGFLQTSYSGTLHEPDEDGEDQCIGTFRGTNSFKHNSHHLSNDSWEFFAQKCKEILGGIIQMVSTCASDKARSTVDIDLKSRVINNGKVSSAIPASPKLHTDNRHQPVQPVRAAHAVRPIHSVYPNDFVKETAYRTKPELHHHSDFHHHPSHHHHSEFYHHPYLHHHSGLPRSDLHRIHHGKALEPRERLEEKGAKKLLKKSEPEIRHGEKEELAKKKILEAEKAVNHDLVAAAIHDKEEGIKLMEKQKKELEELIKSVDKKLVHESERLHGEKEGLAKKKMLEAEKAVDDDFAAAIIHEKEKGIELMEKQKKELEQLRKSVDKKLVLESEPERLHGEKEELGEKKILEAEKAVNHDFVAAGIHEKDEGIKLIEKQKKELEELLKLVDKKLFHESEPERLHGEKEELGEKKMLEAAKAVNHDLVAAAIREREQGIKLLEKQKGELGSLRKSVDKKLVHESEPERLHVEKEEVGEKKMLEAEKAVDDDFVAAAIHEKEQGIELMEKQKKELEELSKSVDKKLVYESEPERLHGEKEEVGDKKTLEVEKAVNHDLVAAAIHEKEEGIKLLEKQKGELESLRKSVDKKS